MIESAWPYYLRSAAPPRKAISIDITAPPAAPCLRARAKSQKPRTARLQRTTFGHTWPRSAAIFDRFIEIVAADIETHFRLQ
jgi:hypothetical protein